MRKSFFVGFKKDNYEEKYNNSHTPDYNNGLIINNRIQNNQWESERLNFNETKDKYISSNDDIEKALEDKSSEHSKVIEGLETDIENYESLINRLTERVDIHSLEVRKRAYDVQAVIRTDDLTFNIPANGQVVIDSETFELEIDVKYPPKYRDKVINERLNSYANLFEGIVHPLPSEKEVTKEVYRIRYEDLKIGDAFDIQISYNLSRLLNLDKTTINVVVTDKFDSGSDYMPLNIKKKVYTGGYEGDGEVEEFLYIDENSCIVQVSNTGTSLSFKYEYNDSLMITQRSQEDDIGNFETYERLILPKIIRVGETWEDIYGQKKITGVDVDIDTIWGTLKAVEVTSCNDDNPDNYWQHYYTKELGEVYMLYNGMEDVLVEVELMD